MRTMVGWVALVSCASGSVLAGCANPEERGTTQSLVKTDAFLHEKKVLKVCFVTGARKAPYAAWFTKKGFPRRDASHVEFRKDVRAAIVAVVTSEFTPEKTGLAFSGFGDCQAAEPSKAEADVFVVRSVPLLSEGAYWNSIHEKYADIWGQNIQEGAPTKAGLPMRVTFDMERFCKGSSVKIPFLQCVRLNALHEFGHVAGLGHAHEHPDARKDPACRLQDGSLLDGTGLGRENPRMRIGGAYAPGSVMNYCAEEAYKKGDPKAALKSVTLLPEERALIRRRVPR